MILLSVAHGGCQSKRIGYRAIQQQSERDTERKYLSLVQAQERVYTRIGRNEAAFIECHHIRTNQGDNARDAILFCRTSTPLWRRGPPADWWLGLHPAKYLHEERTRRLVARTYSSSRTPPATS